MLETSPSLSFFGENLTLLDLFHTKFSYDISMTLYTWRFSLKAYKPFSLSSRVVMLLHCRRVTPATFGGNFVTLQSTERVKQACVARIMFSVFQSSEKWERESKTHHTFQLAQPKCVSLERQWDGIEKLSLKLNITASRDWQSLGCRRYKWGITGSDFHVHKLGLASD